MKIIDIPADEAARLVPLLSDLHALHVAEQPARFTAEPAAADLTHWLSDWLRQDTVCALGAESPQGLLLGYLIFEIDSRPALPIRPAETFAMLHHIAVDPAWHRMGVAKALIGEMKARMAQDGVDILRSTYAPFNTASAALMGSMGLSPVLTVAEWRG